MALGMFLSVTLGIIVAMALWSDSIENDLLYSPTSSKHHAAINPRHGDINMSYDIKQLINKCRQAIQDKG